MQVIFLRFSRCVDIEQVSLVHDDGLDDSKLQAEASEERIGGVQAYRRTCSAPPKQFRDVQKQTKSSSLRVLSLLDFIAAIHEMSAMIVLEPILS